MMKQELAFTLRSLRRTPVMVSVIVLTLSLGLGATSALFSIVDRLFLRPPAGVVHPDRLRRLYAVSQRTFDDLPAMYSAFSYTRYLALRNTLAPDAQVIAFTRPESLAFGRDDGGRVRATYVLDDYFPFLGVRPAIGRFFAAGETEVGSPGTVVVLGDALWRRAFAGRTDVLGRSVVLDGRQFAVIGVAPPGFTGTDLDAPDLWLPLSAYPGRPNGEQQWYQSDFPYGPLEMLVCSGVSDERLAAIATTLARRPNGRYTDSTADVEFGPINEALGPTIAGARSISRPEGLVQTDPAVGISARLMGAVILLLVIACANVANLLLGRTIRRRREIAIRIALGVSRRRLFGQLLIETLLLAIASGLGALAVGGWAGSTLRALLLPETHWGDHVYDWHLALFTAAVALCLGVLVAIVPAVQANRVDIDRLLKPGARGSVAGGRLQRGLIIAQVALSMVLLVGAGLFFRSLSRVRGIDLGYSSASRLVTGYITFHDPVGRYDDTYTHATEIGMGMDDVAAELARGPGVERVTVSGYGLMGSYFDGPFRLPGRDVLPVVGGKSHPLGVFAAPDFFGTVGLRLLDGRLFGEADRSVLTANGGLGPRRAVIVNETMAKALWPGERAIGRCVLLERTEQHCTPVVGVVSDAHLQEIVEAPTMVYYLPFPLRSGRGIILRAAPGQNRIAAEELRRALRERFPSAEPPVVTSLEDALAPQLRPWRLGAALFSGFGVLALLIAAVGVFGVVSYAVTQRTLELGIRIALGAQPTDVLRLVVGEQLVIVASGVVLGGGLALAVGRTLGSLLYDTSSYDPTVVAGVTLVLFLSALVATFFPARRASRVDPLGALRVDG